MGGEFPTGTSRYSQNKCSRTGNPYFRVSFLSCPVWGGSLLSSIPMGAPPRANLNNVKLSPSINIQPNNLSLVILCWHFPIWLYSTRAFRDERYYSQKGVLTSLIGLHRKGWVECGSGNGSLTLPKTLCPRIPRQRWYMIPLNSGILNLPFLQ